MIMSSESNSEPSSSRVRSNNFNKTKNSGNVVGAFEPPIPPVVADLRPWGAGEQTDGPRIESRLSDAMHLGLVSDGCQMILSPISFVFPPLQSLTAQDSPT
jgi:hypothetical protein